MAKKGSLATIWIAAHLDRRLNRDNVFSTSIPSSVGEHHFTRSALLRSRSGVSQPESGCSIAPPALYQSQRSDNSFRGFRRYFALLADTIVDPEQPLALRLSGQLLLGVVKIYSKKVGYLFDDCSSAVLKIQEVTGLK